MIATGACCYRPSSRRLHAATDKHILIALCLGVLLLIALCLAILLVAQFSGAQAEPRRIVAGHGVVRVKDKSKPVRAALDARYQALSAAVRHREVKAVLTLLAPESGSEGGQETLAARVRRTLPAASPPLTANYRIGTIDLQDGTARASVDWIFRYRQVIAGKEREVELHVRRDETWLPRSGRWSLSALSPASNLSVRIDGVPAADMTMVDGAFPF